MLVVSFILVVFTRTPLFIFIYIFHLWKKALRVTLLDANLLNEEISGSPCE